MAITLTKGTKEYLPLTVVDTTGVITTLTTPLYDVLYDNDTTLYSGASAVVSGMTALCLLDLSASGPGGLIADGIRLRIFLKFTNAPEIPRLGPIVIYVIDDGA